MRVKQTVTVDGGTSVVTEFLIDPQNHTGYAKAIEEIVDGTTARTYVMGHEIISQTDDAGGVRFFLHDGHGSTRALLDAAAAVVERYAYDAFGETLGGAGLTLAKDAATTWLFAGDGQFDPSNGLVNHIARWRQGHRFLSTDPFDGSIQDPLSLHKYVYANGDTVNGIDPSGEYFSLLDFLFGDNGDNEDDEDEPATKVPATKAAIRGIPQSQFSFSIRHLPQTNLYFRERTSGTTAKDLLNDLYWARKFGWPIEKLIIKGHGVQDYGIVDDNNRYMILTDRNKIYNGGGLLPKN